MINSYKFPSVHDKEKNSTWSLHVGKWDKKESIFADFAKIDGDTLTLEPKGKKYDGKTFHFTV